MIQAAKVLTICGLDLLQYPSILKKAKAKWENRLSGRIFYSLLPDDGKPPLTMNTTVMGKYK